MQMYKIITNYDEFIRKSSLYTFCTLLQTLFLGASEFILYLCDNKKRKLWY